MSKLSVYIIGSGGHAQQVIDILEINYIIKGFFDDAYPNKKYMYHNTKYPIIDTIQNIYNHIDKDTNLFCSIGDNTQRKNICTKLSNFKFINCISPYARISTNAITSTGNYIGHNVIISGGTIIGSYNILNDCCVLPHDCVIGNYNHISIGAVCGGGVHMGDLNLMGLNSTVLPKIIIGNNNILGAGTVLLHNITNNSKYCGNPGKIIKSL